MTFREQIETYLAPLPHEWKCKLTDLLCEINDSRQTPDCEDFKDCETLTSLSDFSVEEGEICIDYRDENGVTVTRCFDLDTVLNQELNELDPECLTDQTTWDSLTFVERLQLLIDSHCDCCEETTTTTTSSSTTTTTTNA